MSAVGRDFMPSGAHGTDTIEFHQLPDTTFVNIEPCLFELCSHAEPAVGLVAQGMLFANMRQDFQVGALALASPSGNPCTIATCGDLQNTVQSLNGPEGTMLPHEGEPYVV